MPLPIDGMLQLKTNTNTNPQFTSFFATQRARAINPSQHIAHLHSVESDYQ